MASQKDFDSVKALYVVSVFNPLAALLPFRISGQRFREGTLLALAEVSTERCRPGSF